jgi:hypothetical protein
MLLIEMNNDLDVAVSAEYMALSFKLGALFDEIEQFAITDDGDTSILIEDRLPPIGQTDNAETPVGKAYTGRDEEAVIVGSSVP